MPAGMGGCASPFRFSIDSFVLGEFVKKTTVTIMALALSAAVALAQDKPAAAPAAGDDPVVISAPGVQVHKSEFEAALKTLPQEYQQFAQGPGKRQFAEDYVRMKLLAAEGVQAGLDKDPEVVSQLALMRENLVANAQLKKIDASIKPADADLKAYYESHKNDYEQVKARHILIAFKGSAAAQAGKPDLTEEQAKAKAEDLRKQIMAGANFEELAKKESDDTGSGSRGGDLGAFGRGQMVPEFEKAAFDAKPGEIPPVVRTQYGYHVIKVEAHEYTPFDTVKGSIEKTVHQEKIKTALDDLKSKATFSDTYFAPPAAEKTPATPQDMSNAAAAAAAQQKPPATKKP
jgi:peptidyl-prolyl cis-trans isomerase C